MSLLRYNFKNGLTPSFQAGGVIGSAVSNGSLSVFTRSSDGYSTDPVLRTNPNVNNLAVNAATAVANNSYLEFTITPNGKTLNLASLTWNGARGGAGTPRGYAVRSSRDNYAANLATADYATVRTTFAAISVNLTGAAFQNLTEPVTFRIYIYCPSGGNSTEQDDIRINGTAVGRARAGTRQPAGARLPVTSRLPAVRSS